MITLNDALTEIDNIWFKHSEKVDMQVLICKIFDQQDQLEQHIKSLEAQLANTEQLTCKNCLIYGNCNIRKVLINPSLNSYSVCLTEEAKLFGCNYHESKGTK